MSEADDRVAEVLHAVGCNLIALLPVWKIVWRAIHIDRNESVVVKKIRPGLAGFNEHLRFRREPEIFGV